MSRRGFYPPSHRDPRRPQQEICDVTGFVVPGADLITSDVQGLRGARVSSATPFLARARQQVSYQDRLNLTEVTSIIGQGRVYDAGNQQWFGESFPQEWATPQALDDLVLWFRNDDIPYRAPGLVSSGAVLWPVPGGLGLPSASALFDERPVLLADPYALGFRALGFDTTDSMALSAAVVLETAFTYSIAFSTPAALAETWLVRGATGGIRITAAGGVEVVLDDTTVLTAAGAGTLAISTAYVLTVTRAAAGAVSCRRNGADVSGAGSGAGTLTLTALGHGAVGGMVLIVSEEHLHEADHSTDARLPALERTLGRYIGVEI